MSSSSSSSFTATWMKKLLLHDVVPVPSESLDICPDCDFTHNNNNLEVIEIDSGSVGGRLCRLCLCMFCGYENAVSPPSRAGRHYDEEEKDLMYEEKKSLADRYLRNAHSHSAAAGGRHAIASTTTLSSSPPTLSSSSPSSLEGLVQCATCANSFGVNKFHLSCAVSHCVIRIKKETRDEEEEDDDSEFVVANEVRCNQCGKVLMGKRGGGGGGSWDGGSKKKMEEDERGGAADERIKAEDNDDRNAARTTTSSNITDVDGNQDKRPPLSENDEALPPQSTSHFPAAVATSSLDWSAILRQTDPRGISPAILQFGAFALALQDANLRLDQLGHFAPPCCLEVTAAVSPQTGLTHLTHPLWAKTQEERAQHRQELEARNRKLSAAQQRAAADPATNIHDVEPSTRDSQNVSVASARMVVDGTAVQEYRARLQTDRPMTITELLYAQEDRYTKHVAEPLLQRLKLLPSGASLLSKQRKRARPEGEETNHNNSTVAAAPSPLRSVGKVTGGGTASTGRLLAALSPVAQQRLRSRESGL